MNVAGLGRYGYGGSGLYGGGYGSVFGSGYGGYGGYGSGSYFGGSAFGAGGAVPGGMTHAPQAVQSGFRLVNQIVEVFNKLSYLIGISFDSIRNSFASLIGLYEGLWPLLTAVQGLAIFRFLRALYDKLRALLDWILGREHKTDDATSNSSALVVKQDATGRSAEDLAWEGRFMDEDAASKNRPAPLIVRALAAAAIIFGVPYVLYHGYAFLTGKSSNSSAESSQQQHHTIAAKAPASVSSEASSSSTATGSVASVFRAKHSFEHPGEGEVGFRAGQAVRVLDPRAVPGQESWGFAEVDGQRGLVPLNYLTTF